MSNRQVEVRHSLIIAMLTLLLSANSSHAQTRSGTVAVGMFTKDDLVLAVDSRATVKLGGGVVRTLDDQCKLAVFDGNIAFAVAGLYHLDDPEGFDLLEIAKNDAKGRAINSLDDLRTLTGNWVDDSTAAFKVLTGHAEWASAPPIGSVIAEGIFAGRDSSGRVLVSFSSIRHTANSEPFVSPWTNFMTDDSDAPARVYAGLGQNAIVELRAGKTKRARANAGMISRLESARTVAEMENASMAFAQLVAQWFPKKVGGKIDQVHLGPRGTDWVHRKETCRQKYP